MSDQKKRSIVGTIEHNKSCELEVRTYLIDFHRNGFPMGSLNARRQVIEQMLLPEVGIFPHGCSSKCSTSRNQQDGAPEGPGDLQLLYSP
ncbi:MAG: hypothetical protein CBARDCOR_2435 [uncultured Caballeronia sp.]|nr:MAG: hypothetical protein CBARDCOR_2435 [uncultured Caballeronia sp.]